MTESTLETQSTGLWESLDSMMTATATNDNVADADVSSTSALDDDVKTYLKDMAIGRNGCPLTWWRQNKSLSLLNHFLQSQRPVSIQSV